MSIDLLRLSENIKDILKGEGITTTLRLSLYSEEDLLKINGITEEELMQIIGALHCAGLSLNEENIGVLYYNPNLLMADNKKLYHIHKKGIKDDMWYEGAVINTKDFVSALYTYCMKAHCSANLGNMHIPFEYIIDSILRDKSYPDYENVLRDCVNVLHNFNISKSELTVEYVREKFFPYMPSRKNAIWLCDEDSIDYWLSSIHADSSAEIYEVSASGLFFKGDDTLLPDLVLNFEDSYKQAKKYWGNRETPNNPEYVFNGELVLTKRIR